MKKKHWNENKIEWRIVKNLYKSKRVIYTQIQYITKSENIFCLQGYFSVQITD